MIKPSCQEVSEGGQEILIKVYQASIKSRDQAIQLEDYQKLYRSPFNQESRQSRDKQSRKSRDQEFRKSRNQEYRKSREQEDRESEGQGTGGQGTVREGTGG